MRKIDLHPLSLRIWHWVNAMVMLSLIITGIQLRLAGMASLQPHDFGLLFHRYAGWAMAASFVLWLAVSLASGHLRRHFALKRGDLRGVFGQAKFYLLSIFKGGENPFRPTPEAKYNPLQKLAYGTVMLVFVPVQVATGILVSDIPFLRDVVLLWNAAGMINAIHVICAYAFVLYLIVHVYMATLGPTVFSHTRAMIVGYEIEEQAGQVAGGDQGAARLPAASTEA